MGHVSVTVQNTIHNPAPAQPKRKKSRRKAKKAPYGPGHAYEGARDIHGPSAVAQKIAQLNPLSDMNRVLMAAPLQHLGAAHISHLLPPGARQVGENLPAGVGALLAQHQRALDDLRDRGEGVNQRLAQGGLMIGREMDNLRMGNERNTELLREHVAFLRNLGEITHSPPLAPQGVAQPPAGLNVEGAPAAPAPPTEGLDDSDDEEGAAPPPPPPPAGRRRGAGPSRPETRAFAAGPASNTRSRARAAPLQGQQRFDPNNIFGIVR